MITWRGSRDLRRVALTFDDGPDPEFTPQVLDILERRNARATFFLLGEKVVAHVSTVRRMVDAGHEIGIHGWDHTLGDLSGQTLWTRKMLRALGVDTDLFRPPGGTLLPDTTLWMIRNGYRTVLWSYDLRDSTPYRCRATSGDPLDPIRPGDVVLMHDDNPVCTHELPSILTMLDDHGLEPVTVSELLS